MLYFIRALLGKRFCPWCLPSPDEYTWWERHFIEGRIGRMKSWRWFDNHILLPIIMHTGHPWHCRFHVEPIPRAYIGQPVMYHDEGPYIVTFVSGDDITLSDGRMVSFIHCCTPAEE
jgi:hypothetical protein